jgi:Zn-dependent protease with chaperone function
MIKRHPFRSLGIVLAAAIVFFVLSAAGQEDSFWKNGPSWLGSTAWICFALSLLAFLGLAVYLAVARLVSRKRSRAVA